MKQWRALGRASVFPNIHFLHRQATREKLAASKALTETARRRHLELAEQYLKRAEQAQRMVRA
jgi:hypothetical protein